MIKKFLIIAVVCFIAILLFIYYQNFTKKNNTQNTSFSISSGEMKAKEANKSTMKITSSAFKDGEQIPKEFTCAGENQNPPLEFQNIPKEAKSLAVILEDPDTPMGITWFHWILFNISPNTKAIEPHSKPEEAIEGTGSGNTIGYQGPCPPNPKAHRYIFTLYALDKMFDLPKTTDVPGFRDAIMGHIIEETKLTGLYTGPAKRQ